MLVPDYLHDKPLCMRTLNYLFNTAREPRRGTDELQKSPAQEDYMVVMKSGLCFQFFHHDRSGGLSLASLIALFRSICNEPIYPAASVTALTAADRTLGLRFIRSVKVINKTLTETHRFEKLSRMFTRKIEGSCRS